MGAWDNETMNSDDDKNEINRVRKQAKVYASETSIHGIKYISEDGRPQIERFIWLFLCIGSFCLAIYLIEPIYSKWRGSPTFTSIETTNYPVWNIDFPAVTVCSNNKVMRGQLENALKKPP